MALQPGQRRGNQPGTQSPAGFVVERGNDERTTASRRRVEGKKEVGGCPVVEQARCGSVGRNLKPRRLGQLRILEQPRHYLVTTPVLPDVPCQSSQISPVGICEKKLGERGFVVVAKRGFEIPHPPLE